MGVRGEEMAQAVTDAAGGVVMVIVLRVVVLVPVVVSVAHVGPLPVRGWTYDAHRVIMCV